MSLAAHLICIHSVFIVAKHLITEWFSASHRLVRLPLSWPMFDLKTFTESAQKNCHISEIPAILTILEHTYE